MPHLGILTSRSHPTLPYLLDELATVPGLRLTLLFDAKDFSDKDRAIFADRTQGAFPPRDTVPLKPILWRVLAYSLPILPRPTMRNLDI